mmetsp:Transcript_53518/g.73369  ORF Transcript_53518/g.73369 Transcript_53518/m.73369 type:complete len:95 (+) Transcript_53518:1031-1315(+)
MQSRRALCLVSSDGWVRPPLVYDIGAPARRLGRPPRALPASSSSRRKLSSTPCAGARARSGDSAGAPGDAMGVEWAEGMPWPYGVHPTPGARNP